LCKLHTKKSKHRGDGDKWRDDLYGKLIKDDQFIKMVYNYFEQYPEIGIIGPEGHLLNTRNYWGYNKKLVQKISKQLGYQNEEEFHFVAGTMFWIKTDILTILKSLNLKESDFENEADLVNIKDGTLSHAIERIFSIFCAINNNIVIDTRIFNRYLGVDFKSIKRYDPNNYDFAIPITE
jgi:lipopolysaccharide biosynthesis protein